MERLNCVFSTTIIVLLLGLSLVSCEVHYITTAPDDSNCPTSSCLTLSQFAGNSTKYIDLNTTLFITGGNHRLNTELAISHISAFSMLSNDDNSTSTIFCSNDVRLTLSNVTNANFSGLTFVGCDGGRFESIDQLNIERSVYMGQNSSKTALAISESSANISETTFLSNTGASNGGALSVKNSSLVVDSCQFEGNRAGSGGAIYSESESTITVRNSIFTSNHASGCEGVACSNNGGAMYINGSGLVSVDGSIFRNNSCTGDGGVAYAFNATLLVSQSSAYNNTAAMSGDSYMPQEAPS